MTTQNANKFISILRTMRLHQWAKNILLFFPLLLAHRVSEVPLLIQNLLAFLSFSFCASATYLFNDLLDLRNDRAHPTKKHRPLAAGLVSTKRGVFLMVLLFAVSLALATSLLPFFFLKSLFLYIVVSLSYSLYLKRFPIIDVFVLAGLYTLRLMAGGFATNIPLSPWFLAFSMFFFTNLAFVKRFAELQTVTVAGGRDYSAVDKSLIGIIGPASGYLSALVFVIYLNSSKEATLLYRHPMTLWLIAPFLLYWITHFWFLAYRGKMHDDPIAFALKDPVSYVIGLVILMIGWSAT